MSELSLQGPWSDREREDIDYTTWMEDFLNWRYEEFGMSTIIRALILSWTRKSANVYSLCVDTIREQYDSTWLRSREVDKWLSNAGSKASHSHKCRRRKCRIVLPDYFWVQIICWNPERSDLHQLPTPHNSSCSIVSLFSAEFLHNVIVPSAKADVSA